MQRVKTIKLISMFIFIATVVFGIIGGCNGNGNRREFRVFDVELFGFEFDEDFFGPCSQDTAELILRLFIDGSEASGSFQLKGFGRVGLKTDVLGTVEDSTISFQPFSVSVDDGMNVAGFGPSSLNFFFDSYSGILIDINGDQSPDEIIGNATGSISEVEGGDVIICNGGITADFLAIAENACLEKEDLANSQCPAFEISKVCEPFICSGEFGGNIIDFIMLPPRDDCQVVDCNTLDCGEGVVFNNLQIENGLPTGTLGEEVQLSCGGPAI